MVLAALMHADSRDDRLATALALYATGSNGTYSGIVCVSGSGDSTSFAASSPAWEGAPILSMSAWSAASFAVSLRGGASSVGSAGETGVGLTSTTPALTSSADTSAGASDAPSAAAPVSVLARGGGFPRVALSKRDAPRIPLVLPRNRPSAPSLTTFWLGLVCGISSRVRPRRTV